MQLNTLFLTCKDDEEADKISKILLEKRLIVCAKKTPVSSSYLWKGKVESSNEILLIMDSLLENFDRINEELKAIHSYETFNLMSVNVNKTTSEVESWIKEEL